MTFGEKIKKLRDEAGISQEGLADQLKVSRQAISKWETDNGYPETEKIIRMSKLYGVTLDYLLNDDNEGAGGAAPEAVDEGYYVSQEMAEGFLLHQGQRFKKIAFGCALIPSGTSLPLIIGPVGFYLFLLIAIVGIGLIVSVFLAGTPYKEIWQGNLEFDRQYKISYDKQFFLERKKCISLTLLGALIVAFGGFLFTPIMALLGIQGNYVAGIGLLIAGAGVYLIIYKLGMLRSQKALYQ